MAEVKKVFTVSLDTKQPTSNREIEVVEGDTGNEILITLTDSGTPVSLTDCTVNAAFAKPDGSTALQDTNGNGVTVGGEAANEITIDLYSTSFSPGMVTCEIQVFSGEGMTTLITSAQFNFKCRRGIVSDDTVQSTDEWPLLTSLIQRVEDIEEVEALRVVAESEREAQEDSREQGEELRDEAEAARVAAEAARVEAENARSEAADWREAFIKGMTAEAETLQPGLSATAELDTSSGTAVLRIGVPRGQDGRDAVSIVHNGLFAMEVSDEGDLIVCVPSGTQPPPIYIDENGDLIYEIG